MSACIDLNLTPSPGKYEAVGFIENGQFKIECLRKPEPELVWVFVLAIALFVFLGAWLARRKSEMPSIEAEYESYEDWHSP